MVVFNHREQLYQNKTESWKTHKRLSLIILSTLSCQQKAVKLPGTNPPRTFLTRKEPVPCKCVEAQGQIPVPWLQHLWDFCPVGKAASERDEIQKLQKTNTLRKGGLPVGPV